MNEVIANITAIKQYLTNNSNNKSDLTIICLYPSLVLDFIKNNQFKKGSIITDAVGIKSYFLQEAMNIIDPDVEFVSGHPMAGITLQ